MSTTDERYAEWKQSRAVEQQRQEPGHVQLDLLAPTVPTVDRGVHRVDAPDTSVAAAKSMDRQCTGKQHLRLLDVLDAAYPGGLTDEQLQDRAEVSASSQRPRRGELVAAGLVADTGRTRPTRSGRAAVVWAITPKGREALLRYRAGAA
jgi:hypothetical protein